MLFDDKFELYLPIFVMNLRKRGKLIKTIEIQNFCPKFLLNVHVTKMYHRRDSFEFFIPHPYINIQHIKGDFFKKIRH